MRGGESGNDVVEEREVVEEGRSGEKECDWLMRLGFGFGENLSPSYSRDSDSDFDGSKKLLELRI